MHLNDTIIPEHRDKVVKWVLANLLPDDEYETIAVRGTSGISIGAIIAYLKKKPLCVVRKASSIHFQDQYFLKCF